MNNVELVIFDCDGVLVDSERVSNTVFLQMLAELGIHMSEDQLIQDYVGMTMKACLQLMTQRYGIDFPDSFKQELDTRMVAVYQQKLTAMPGVRGVIENLNLPFCLASNSTPDKIAFMLKLVGLYDFFQGRIYSGTQVANPKPAPDVYLLAASASGVAPAHCLVIEDTPTGIRAAKSAGMRVLGYAGLFAASQLRAAGADAVFDDMHALHQQAGFAALLAGVPLTTA